MLVTSSLPCLASSSLTVSQIYLNSRGTVAL